MDLDKLLIAAILRDGQHAFKLAIEQGVTEDYLSDEGGQAWKFIHDFVSQHRALPSIVALEGTTGIRLEDPPPDPSAYFVQEVLNRKLHTSIHEQLLAVNTLLKAGDPQAAQAAFSEGARKIRDLGVGRTKTVPMMSLTDDFLEYYEKVKAGYRGILTPWESVNESTFGFWPQDFVLYVARLAIGKTWILLLLADHAWREQGKRVLVVSTEMAQEKMFQRWVAIYERFAYDLVRKGRLGTFAEKKMHEALDRIRHDDRLRVVGGDFDFTFDELEAAIDESEPDIVFVDGAYLLRSSGVNRIERASSVFDDLKRTAKRNKVPLVATTQFNREVNSKGDNVDASKIALSDSAGWNTDLAYGLICTDEMRVHKRLLQRPLKFREGFGSDVEINWDFEAMDFSEVPSGPQAVPSAGGDPGPYGASGGAGGGPGAVPDPNSLPF